jgi:hypothetical protein
VAIAFSATSSGLISPRRARPCAAAMVSFTIRLPQAVGRGRQFGNGKEGVGRRDPAAPVRATGSRRQ